jgi:hypothetical protein
MSIERLRKTESRSANKLAKAPFWPYGASTVTLCNLALFYLSHYPGHRVEIGVTMYVCILNCQVKRSFICMVRLHYHRNSEK